jgi:sulfite oxidase
VPPTVNWDKDIKNITPIYETPINSTITYPLNNSKIKKDEELVIKGIAYAGGGRGCERVDISLDGGKTWYQADLNKNNQKFMKNWAWTLFQLNIDLDDVNIEKDELEIVCRAIDSSHNVQSENTLQIWNHRGLLSNPYHRIKLKVV